MAEHLHGETSPNLTFGEHSVDEVQRRNAFAWMEQARTRFGEAGIPAVNLPTDERNPYDKQSLRFAHYDFGDNVVDIVMHRQNGLEDPSFTDSPVVRIDQCYVMHGTQDGVTIDVIRDNRLEERAFEEIFSIDDPAANEALLGDILQTKHSALIQQIGDAPASARDVSRLQQWLRTIAQS